MAAVYRDTIPTLQTEGHLLLTPARPNRASTRSVGHCRRRAKHRHQTQNKNSPHATPPGENCLEEPNLVVQQPRHLQLQQLVQVLPVESMRLRLRHELIVQVEDRRAS